MFYLVLCAAGFCFVANLWVKGASRGRIYFSLEDVPKRHTAVVPGAGVFPDGAPSAILEDRLITALDLYQKGKVRKILVSGDHGTKWYDEVNAMYEWLKNRGVPDKDIFLDYAGFRTLDTMFRASAVFGVKDAVICTQRFHLSRSIFLARRVHIDAVGLVADRRRYRHQILNEARELFARTASVLDVYVLHRNPKYYGDTISIYGDGRRSHD